LFRGQRKKNLINLEYNEHTVRFGDNKESNLPINSKANDYLIRRK